MKKLAVFTIILAVGLIFAARDAYANNIRVQNVSFYSNTNQPAGTIDIKFDVFWDNSFTGTDANSQTYFDRAWIFVKFWNNGWDQTTQAWGHCTLTTGGTLTTYSYSTNTGISADGKGAFTSPGASQTIRWNYSADGLSSTSTIKIRVMAIEMVYVPTGSFYAGDGASDASQFTVTQINTANATTAPSGSPLAGGYPSGQTAPANASWPNGYSAFYLMKYDISQSQYSDFLNTLSRGQQNNRTASQTANYYVMSGTAGVTNRNGIRASAVIGSGAITFGCDLNANGVFNEATDGEWIACNYLDWADVAAYAAWAGLRPITELEFEKACRGGGSAAVNGEYAWGSTNITHANTLANSGANNEGAAEAGAGLCNYAPVGDAGFQGPIRCGFAAGSATTRLQAGSSCYGIMDLSGNVWKRIVTIGNANGRAFTGLHGNGYLDTNGNASVSNWPDPTTATGAGFRGGSWIHIASLSRVSDRYIAASTDAARDSYYGGRCARTSP